VLTTIFADDLAGFLLVQAGNGLRLARFACCGYLAWRLLRNEYPWRAWVARIRLHVGGAVFTESK
jgi:hypothetical protein